MAFTAGGHFNFLTAQGRHLFKKTNFTVSTLPRARRSASGQQDVGHEGVALATPEFLAFLPLSNSLVVGSSYSHCSRDEQDVLVSKLVIDVTDFSRPGVAALRYSHSS